MKRSFLPTLLAVLLAPLVILYLCQVLWLDSLLDPFPWLAGHLAAAGLFWLLFSGLSLTLYGFFRRPLLACVPGDHRDAAPDLHQPDQNEYQRRPPAAQ